MYSPWHASNSLGHISNLFLVCTTNRAEVMHSVMLHRAMAQIRALSHSTSAFNPAQSFPLARPGRDFSSLVAISFPKLTPGRPCPAYLGSPALPLVPRGSRSIQARETTQRPTLDDVDRLSRGKSSKAKIGSRRIPHRLSADERKGYDLARKRGFVVLPVRSRRYPLANTYRNYCEAVVWPNIRVEQADSTSDEKVSVDLLTLRLDSESLAMLKEKIASLGDEFMERYHLQGKGRSPNEAKDSPKSADIDKMDATELTDGLKHGKGKMRGQLDSTNTSQVASAGERRDVEDEEPGGYPESTPELEDPKLAEDNPGAHLNSGKASEILTFSVQKQMAKAFAKEVLKLCLAHTSSRKIPSYS